MDIFAAALHGPSSDARWRLANSDTVVARSPASSGRGANQRRGKTGNQGVLS